MRTAGQRHEFQFGGNFRVCPSIKLCSRTTAALKTEFRVEPQIPFFAKMMAAVRGFITSGSTYKKQLRVEIQQRTAQFLEDLNDVIDKLQQQLRDRGKKGLVIIIDSLDRIIPHALDEKGTRTTHSAIYLEHAEHLKAPHCHAIYTVPISIYFNENLNKVYPDMPLMLPMIKVIEEDGKICADGLDAMRRVIALSFDRLGISKLRTLGRFAPRRARNLQVQSSLGK